ncbi:MAG: 2'-5' RNA ligase family protein [Candidatus Rokubacteria bacterium]|nr:2'-5' RNA ligase family protein [Candidatus Rokubacteria bacterium]
MPYALELELDGGAGAAVRDLWRALSEVGVTWMAQSGAAPHVSLAIWETIDRPRFEVELARFAAETGPIGISFDGVGTFPGGTVFLRPTPNRALDALQRHVHARFAALGAGPWDYYLPETWIPHCTLAMDVPPGRVSEALAVAADAPLPITGRLEFVGIVEFRPVRVLARYPLGA